MYSFVLFFLIQTLGPILLLFPNNSCPPIFILGSKVGLDRTDSLGPATVGIRVLSRWYSSTRQCGSSTVALDGHWCVLSESNKIYAEHAPFK
jgi:hypothetical protein